MLYLFDLNIFLYILVFTMLLIPTRKLNQYIVFDKDEREVRSGRPSYSIKYSKQSPLSIHWISTIYCFGNEDACKNTAPSLNEIPKETIPEKNSG
jgi:hypothetical protein